MQAGGCLQTTGTQQKTDHKHYTPYICNTRSHGAYACPALEPCFRAFPNCVSNNSVIAPNENWYCLVDLINIILACFMQVCSAESVQADGNAILVKGILNGIP
jgi:hypothetical protein